MEGSYNVIEDYGIRTCPICFNILSDDQKMKKELTCKHSFCQDCYIKWTNQHTTCPICRREILPDADPEHDDAQLICGFAFVSLIIVALFFLIFAEKVIAA
jgi:hypothetical protein